MWDRGDFKNCGGDFGGIGEEQERKEKI